jgi:hypothetical protein
MALSNQTNYTTNRDAIITRALRICNNIGTGETPNATRISECALVLNDIFKEWETLGMQLWKQSTIQLTPLTAGVASYSIGVGSTIATTAPLKILDAYKRYTTSGADSPIILITKREYDMYNTKTVSGPVTQLYYNPPGSISGTENIGTVYLVGPPDANFVANYQLYVTGIFPMMDFDASTDIPDIPQYLYNALVWALAEQIMFEEGVPMAERSQIGKQADKHLARAISFDIEEGSLYFQPNWQAQSDGYE